MGRPVAAIVGGVALALVGGGAAAAQSFTATYAFSWAGIEVGILEARVQLAADTYRARWEGRTTGIVGSLFPFESRGTAQGRSEGGRLEVARYGGESSWRDGSSAWQVTFDAAGRAAAVELPASERARRDPVPAELQVAPDPATLALTAIAAASPGARLDARSFDGRRAIGFALACGEAEPVTGGELSCAVSGELLAGRLRDSPLPEQGRADREPVQVWLRRGVQGDGYWPVRLEAASRFGTVTGRLMAFDPGPDAG